MPLLPVHPRTCPGDDLHLPPQLSRLSPQARVGGHQPLCLCTVVIQLRGHGLILKHGALGGLLQVVVCIVKRVKEVCA